MGFLDALFGGQTAPVVTSILPLAARQEIMNGRLPRLNTDKIFLKKGEYCCYIDKAILAIDKVKKVYRHIGTSAPGLFKGQRISFGQGIPKEYVESENHKAILYVTNQRIILQCKGHGFDKAYRYLSAIKPYDNAIELQYGNKTYELFVPDGVVLYKAIQLVQQNRS